MTVGLRPYYAENTGSHPNPEVKLHQARLVLGWGTTLEPRVLQAFLRSFPPQLGGLFVSRSRCWYVGLSSHDPLWLPQVSLRLSHDSLWFCRRSIWELWGVAGLSLALIGFFAAVVGRLDVAGTWSYAGGR